MSFTRLMKPRVRFHFHYTAYIAHIYIRGWNETFRSETETRPRHLFFSTRRDRDQDLPTFLRDRNETETFEFQPETETETRLELIGRDRDIFRDVSAFFRNMSKSWEKLEITIWLFQNSIYTVSQLNWYPFCFANIFVNSENNSMKFYRSLEWWIIRVSRKCNQVLSTGSKVMLVQIWTNKFWTFQHVKDTTLLNKNYDVMSFVEYISVSLDIPGIVLWVPGLSSWFNMWASTS